MTPSAASNRRSRSSASGQSPRRGSRPFTFGGREKRGSRLSLSMVTTQGTGSGGTPVLFRLAMIVVATVIFLLTFGYAYHFEVGGLRLGGFGASAFGYVLALLPGAAAIGHYLSATYSSRQRSVPRLIEYCA